jgi:hypothetical protein
MPMKHFTASQNSLEKYLVDSGYESEELQELKIEIGFKNGV